MLWARADLHLPLPLPPSPSRAAAPGHPRGTRAATAARTPHRSMPLTTQPDSFEWQTQAVTRPLSLNRALPVFHCCYTSMAVTLPLLVPDPACNRCGTRRRDVPGPGRSRGHGTAACRAGGTKVNPLLLCGPLHTSSGTGGRTG
jgi:hypothetical protein